MPNPKSSAPATHTSTTEKRELSANNFIAISTVILIIAVVLTGLFVKGQWPSIKLNNKVIDKKSAANKQLDKNLEAIPKLLARVNSLGPQSQLILDALPVKADFPTIIGASEVMATASGVKLNGVNSTETAVTTTNNPNAAPPTTAAVPADQPQPFRYSVDVTGSYTSIISYFHNLEISARPTRVVSLKLTGANNPMTLQAVLETFYMGPYDMTPKFEDVK